MTGTADGNDVATEPSSVDDDDDDGNGVASSDEAMKPAACAYTGKVKSQPKEDKTL